ncbi:thiamine ABC transporter permease [Moritella marina ATCC 15381]|uniref:Thiamine ABC transporter permease n=1 Tax=Moritella marina ATCC 15381 TaxID=1202962 RepID=A0A5J6WJJ0_MORMI|nr:thiamine ABC transporter permease [Moritella marina]QFI38223.1 thiamine ABC transporter permease [Moritella marina ATCC 15381]
MNALLKSVNSQSIASITFKVVVLLTVIISFLPLFPGLVGLIFAAFGYIPAIDQYTFSFTGFNALLAWPGLNQSIMLTLFVSITSTLLSAVCCFAILQSCWHSRWWKQIETLLAPIMALPHVAFAVGFAFLFTPSGFIARVFGEQIDWQLIHDQYGIGLILALTLKEIPFLLFMSIPLLKQLNINTTLITAQSLGYNNAQAWQKIILPQWLPKIRFSLFAVMAYSISVVDVALIIGPTQPPTLAVLVWQWLNDADLATLPKASAGALVLLLLCLVTLFSIRLAEWLITVKCKTWQSNGRYSLPIGGKSIITITYLIALITLPMLLIWSFAQRWRFPDITPSKWSLRFWQQEWHYLLDIIANSMMIALISATIALIFAIIVHEHSVKAAANKQWLKVPRLLIAIPMLAPQLSLLFGMQVATLYIAHQYYYLWVIWAHTFFAFPYIFLALDGPWRSYDQRLDNVALSLGMSPFKTWWQIKRPLLLPAIWIAWAVGISVSLAQYLPTLMLGSGRISTLTTEAVALSSGQDRRISAIYALLQSITPFIFYIIAIVASRKTGSLEQQDAGSNHHTHATTSAPPSTSTNRVTTRNVSISK